jgi:hypothetical protein
LICNAALTGLATSSRDAPDATERGARQTISPSEQPFSKGCAMRPPLLALALAILPGVALAQPPATGTTHTFVDPLFTGTVFCDTYDQVREIATADDPALAYENYLLTPNERSEPTCATIVPTGVVVKVRPIGVMEQDGLHFNAFAVETQVGGTTGYALYLEHFEMVRA